jgi:hypothetical protein
MIRPSHPIDDVSITYRYAENIASGVGFVFNPGEHVLGVSVPLYTLLLAALASIGLSGPTAGPLIGSLASLGLVGVLYRFLARVADARTALVGVVVLACFGRFSLWTVQGMESPLHGLLILSTFALAQEKRPLAAAFTAGLAVVSKLDGLVALIALLMSIVLTERRVPWREALVAAVTLMPWFVFSELWFGVWRPQSLSAKETHGSGLAWWMLEFLLTTPMWLVTAVALFGLIRFAWDLRDTGVVAVLLFSGGYVAAYTLVNLGFGYPWYTFVLMPPLAIGVALALNTLVAWLGAREPRYGTSRFLAGCTAVICLPIVAGEFVPHYRSAHVWGTAVERERYVLADWIVANTEPEASLLTDAVGHLGYLTGRRVIDQAGLLTPDAPELGWCGLAEKYHPTLIISQRPVGAPQLHEWECLPEEYELVLVQPVEVDLEPLGFQAARIYRRR